MSNIQIHTTEYSKSEFLETLKSGYQEMGLLNISLSEEGLHCDLTDLKEYEKFLLESE